MFAEEALFYKSYFFERRQCHRVFYKSLWPLFLEDGERGVFYNHSPAFFFSPKFAVLWNLPAAEVITLLDKSLSPFRPSLSGAILKPPWQAGFATALARKAPQTSSWAARSDVKCWVFLKVGASDSYILD